MSATPVSAEVELYQAIKKVCNDPKESLETIQTILNKNPKLNLNYKPIQGQSDEIIFSPPLADLAYEENTVLLLALSEERLDVANLLLDHMLKNGQNPFAKDESGQAKYLNVVGINALHMLAMVNRDMDETKFKQVQDIIEKLAKFPGFTEEINRQGQIDGRTPLAMTLNYQVDAKWAEAFGSFSRQKVPNMNMAKAVFGQIGCIRVILKKN